MIDLHSHFLPGIDDGAKDPKESLKMLQDSFRQGVEICVGTSHIFVHDEGDVGVFLEKRKFAAEKLNEFLCSVKQKPDIPKLLYGAEVYLDNDVSEKPEIKKLCFSGTNILLAELFPGKYDKNYAEWLYNLNLKGITPILAHVERYPYLERLLEDIGGVNVVLQMNARTVADRRSRPILSRVKDSGKIVVVSSDMHNMSDRKCLMAKAYKKIHSHYPEFADMIFSENARRLLKEKPEA